MRTITILLLLLLLCPASGFADRYRGYRSAPPASHHRYPHQESRYHGDSDDWIVPLAIVGGLFGILALAQLSEPSPPAPPPQRICRDTYNHYDEYGNYLYSRYVDRPCY